MNVERRGDFVALSEGEHTFLLEVADAQQLVIDLYAALPTVSHEEATAMLERQLDVVEVTTGQACALGCHMPIVDRDTYSEVRGYVRTQRKGGGANAVALRKPTGRVAHAHCVEDAKKGGTGQERML